MRSHKPGIFLTRLFLVFSVSQCGLDLKQKQQIDKNLLNFDLLQSISINNNDRNNNNNIDRNIVNTFSIQVGVKCSSSSMASVFRPC